MICDFGIDKLEVKAPNGKPSSAFDVINSIIRNSDEAYSGYLETRTGWFSEMYGDWKNGNVHPKMLDANGEPIPYFIKTNRGENLREQGRTVLYPASLVTKGDIVILAYPPASNMIVSDKTGYNGKNEAFLHSNGRISVFTPESIVYPNGQYKNVVTEPMEGLYNEVAAQKVLNILKNRIQKVLPNVQMEFITSENAPIGLTSLS